jgi:transposase-like protein
MAQIDKVDAFIALGVANFSSDYNCSLKINNVLNKTIDEERKNDSFLESIQIQQKIKNMIENLNNLYNNCNKNIYIKNNINRK